MAKRHHTHPLEVQLLREGIVESKHHVQAVVCDRRGRVLSAAGDPETAAFIRSALKPFQALAVTSTGALERYNLNDRDLAIMCGSHQGNIEQLRQVFRILWQASIEPDQLQCPIPPGKRSPLEHNCSGKHAGMLAVCQQRQLPLTTYLKRNHPIQTLILAKVAELLQMPPDELMVARDDCGAPTYFMQLNQMASLFAQLASGESLDMERIVRAMTHHPDMVGGEGHFDTEVMRISNGSLVSKAGAEGIQCVGRLGDGMGLAIKVTDGSKRAKYAVALHLLRQLGWLQPDNADALAERFTVINEFKRLNIEGELVMM